MAFFHKICRADMSLFLVTIKTKRKKASVNLLKRIPEYLSLPLLREFERGKAQVQRGCVLCRRDYQQVKRLKFSKNQG